MAPKSLQIKDLLEDGDLASAIESLSFEEGMKLLEELVQKVESGSLPLEDSLRSYERGVALVEKLKTLLQGAEKRLEVLQKGQNGSKR